MAAPDREDSPELPEKGRPALFFAAADPGPPELFPAFADIKFLLRETPDFFPQTGPKAGFG